MKHWCLCALLLFLMLLTSCSVLPSEERTFVVVLALDYSNDQWRVCAHVPTYQPDQSYLTLDAVGAELPAALSALNQQAPMQLHFGQVRTIVFSMGLAENPMMQTALDTLMTMNELRQDAILIITQNDITQVCHALQPQTGTRLSKSLDALLKTRTMQGVIPSTTLADIQRYDSKQAFTAAMLHLSNTSDEAFSFQLSGACLFNAQQQACGQLSSDETRLLLMMQGQWTHGALTLDHKTYHITEIKRSIRLEPPSINVYLSLRLAASDSYISVEQQIQPALLSLCRSLSAARCDALGLGKQAIRYFDSRQQWLAADWPEIYAQLQWYVEVDCILPMVENGKK